VKYVDEFVLLAKEGTVLQGVIDGRIEIGRCCGRNWGHENLQATIPGHIMVDQPFDA